MVIDEKMQLFVRQLKKKAKKIAYNQYTFYGYRREMRILVGNC